MCANGLARRSDSEAATIELGREIGTLLQPGDVVLLHAPFGAGKTHLTKGIAQSWGVDPDDVVSPSFVLVNQYEADLAHRGVPIYHVDLYRIDSARELASVGLEETMNGDGICVLEWPEHGGNILPPEHLLIDIEVLGEGERMIRVVGHGARYEDLVRQLTGQSDYAVGN